MKIQGASAAPKGAESCLSVEVSPGLLPWTHDGDLHEHAFHGSEKGGPCRLYRPTNVLWVGRPAECQPNTTGTVFKLVQSGKQAVRVQVGQTSAISVEIRTKAAKIIGRNRRPRTNHASPKHLHSSQISVRFGLSRSTPAPMRYSARSLTCVAMNHLFPNASLTPALRSP